MSGRGGGRSQPQRGGGGSAARGRGGRGRGGLSGSPRPEPQPPAPRPGPSAPSSSRPQAPPAVPSSSPAAMSTPSPAPAARVPTPVKPTDAPSSSTQVSTSAAAEKLSQEVAQKLALIPTPPPQSSKAVTFPVRPGFGTKGRKCLVRANHFIVSVADRDLHHYDVTITPEVSSKVVNRRIISQLVKLFRQSHMGNRLPAYDGRKSLYTAGSLPFESKEFVVNLENDGQGRRERKPREFKVVIKFASKPDLHHLQQFLKSRQFDIPQETIQALDVVLRELASNEYVLAGKSFFSHKLGEVVKFQDGLECWRGYYQSLRPTQMGLSLNIDVSARSFFQTILVHDFVGKFLNLRDISRGLSDQDRIKVRKALNGVKIEVTHMEYPKTYKITGLSKETMGRLTFSTQDGRKASVVQYFRDKYNIVLKCLMLPCLQAGSGSNPVYLPMELCRFVKGQRYTSKLNDKQVSALLKETCQRPVERENNTKKMVRNNNYSKDPLVNDEFGIQVSDELTLIEARVLPPPMLKYHGSGKEANVSPQIGTWNMINKKMVNGGKVGYWTCVSFSSRLHQNDVQEFCRSIVDMCTSKGMVFNQNPIIPVRSADARQIERTLVDIHTESTKMISIDGNTKSQLQLLLIILPDVSGSYGRIKTVCETELGIVSQCCQPSQVMKWSNQYFENVALKINVKVGGRNNVLFDALHSRIPNFNDAPTIVFGADVTHPSPGEDLSPSIAAVVGSVDWPEVTKYRGLVSAQAHREEIIQDLYTLIQDPVKGLRHGGMIREHIRAFRAATGHKPCRIIFYRDGVSEGQFSQVLLHEVDAIRKACNSLEEGYLPRITFVVVQKRHHTRLFAANHNDRSSTDKSGNILPGTVVDSQICHPTEFDFYLNSHAGIKGTSKPTHYHVLYDENNFSADLLQMLTNSLCYTYARCTRAVSVVPPAYYAHLAAFRARYYIEGVETSSSASSAGGATSRERVAEVRPLPAIKDNVKEVMFYC